LPAEQDDHHAGLLVWFLEHVREALDQVVVNPLVTCADDLLKERLDARPVARGGGQRRAAPEVQGCCRLRAWVEGGTVVDMRRWACPERTNFDLRVGRHPQRFEHATHKNFGVGALVE
jgi:hypothetical protein